MKEKQVRPKNLEGLLCYLQQEKGIKISGAEQIQQFRNMGYYHGYKGYRYIGNARNRVAYENFDQLSAVYEFDAQLKAAFYPCVMQIETALKNYVLEKLLELVHSESFLTIYSLLLDNYKQYSTAGNTYKTAKERQKAEDRFKKELKRRLELRNRIYQVQTRAFLDGNPIADHYLRQSESLPIWAIFELLTLGEFGHFVSCLNQDCRIIISKDLGIRVADDTSGILPQRLIYATKDLRNAIAHNDVIFDTRFRSSSIDRQMSNVITNASGIRNITFETITDYVALILYELKLIRSPQMEGLRLLETFSESTEMLYHRVPVKLFHQIIHTDHHTKVHQLKKYLTNSM